MPLSEKLKRLLPKNQNQQSNVEGTYDKVDPIVDDDSLSYEFPYETDALTKIYKFGILLICTIFSTLLILNAYFNMQLRLLLKEQNSKVVRLGRIKDVQDNIVAVSSKINYYKNFLEKRIALEEQLSFLTKTMLNKVSISRMYVSYDEFEINIQVSNAAVFANLINELLQSKIEYLVIQSAVYNSSTDYYEVFLKGRFIDE